MALEDAPIAISSVGTYTLTWTGPGTSFAVNIDARFNLFTTTNQVSASAGSAATTDLWVSIPKEDHAYKVIDPGGNINGYGSIDYVYDAPTVRKAGATTITHRLEVRGQAKATINANPAPNGSASASVTGDFNLTSIVTTPAP